MSFPALISAKMALSAQKRAKRKEKAKRIGRRRVIRISSYDTQWSRLVRERDGACRKCGKRAPYVLHAHHILGRGKKATRLLIENGITLCVHHHVFGDDSAHKVGKQFCIDLIGQGEYDRLHALSLERKTERQAIAEFIERHGTQGRKAA